MYHGTMLEPKNEYQSDFLVEFENMSLVYMRVPRTLTTCVSPGERVHFRSPNGHRRVLAYQPAGRCSVIQAQNYSRIPVSNYAQSTCRTTFCVYFEVLGFFFICHAFKLASCWMDAFNISTDRRKKRVYSMRARILIDWLSRATL
jgi:hypothetical protein